MRKQRTVMNLVCLKPNTKKEKKKHRPLYTPKQVPKSSMHLLSIGDTRRKPIVRETE